ncbi:MAG TPA: CsbD family protein [Trueperaceae bacterium]|nr:CsbD family protein [Trueperaceae bacterium]
MNRDILKGNWNQLKGKVKEQWGMLTDDDMKVIEGNSDQLVGRVQERYGYTREEAERHVNDFLGQHERTAVGHNT